MKDDQYNMAANLGYVESLGEKGVVFPGELVPYDDPSSPLTFREKEDLRHDGFPPGRIYPRRVAKEPKA